MSLSFKSDLKRGLGSGLSVLATAVALLLRGNKALSFVATTIRHSGCEDKLQ